ncbi:two-component system, NarL family, sensor histidine kinase LiaS [Paenibacillus sp. UNC496MF]|uniref:sensor histidine kinase n=1 Tax=Paenibacillus sp. UNC496MF TaxID=1502753 RepID=UPI0008E8D34A|nr:sensor histidine kinase [Paenibacillus sp. UNC496MF]SFI98000.1 two-component system, NarL family, sensor histidine kinase LiaS [Paenibacillus sp. UNC496MF]
MSERTPEPERGEAQEQNDMLTAPVKRSETPVGFRGQGPDPRIPAEAKRKNAAETVLWLFVILGISVLVLQGTGYVKLFALQSKAALIGLSVIAAALVLAAVYSYLQGMKLRAALKRLAEQQRRKRQRVTLPAEVSEDDAEETLSAEDEAWTEQVRFTAVIEERQRLARELHDAVSQQLFAISMTATAVSRTLEKDWERAKRQVQLIEEMASVAQSEMRALLLHLRPVHLDGKHLSQALHGLVDELKQKVPMAITLEADVAVKLGAEAEDHLFRIAQEALSNSLRHSKADQLNIYLQQAGAYVRLTVQDNGVGFHAEEKKQTSYGLLTMEERVNELGGSMKLITSPGNGVVIDIWVPSAAPDGGGISPNGSDRTNGQHRAAY